MKQFKATIILLLLWAAFAQTATAVTLHLSIASSMTDLFREFIRVYKKVDPDVNILANYGSSGMLAKQIAHGAPADIYISANHKWMNYLIGDKAVDPSTARVFAYNKLVFLGSADVKMTNLQDIISLDKIGIGNPMSVPAGLYAKQAMDAAGIYSSLKKNRQLVLAKDVRQALLYADRGEVDGAFVYKTDAVLARNSEILFTVNENLYTRVSYPIGITSHGISKKEARAFYEFVGSQMGREILQKYGFEPQPLQE